MLLTANGFRVVEGSITLPLTGVWHADLSVDTDDAEPLAAEIEIVLEGGATLKGFARRARAFLGRVGVRVVAGNGGLSQVIESAHYKSVPARIPAQDIADAAGETLDPASSVDAEFAHWTRIRDRAGVQLALLAQQLDIPWRLTLDGKILIKAIDWKDSRVQLMDIIDQNPVEGTITVGRWLEPGTTVLSQKVTRTVVSVGGDGLRARAWVDNV